MKTLLLVVLVFTVLASPAPLLAWTIYVDADNTTGPWDGTSAHPFRYIQTGLDEAQASGDTVLVGAGVYVGTRNKDLTFDGKAVTLRSEDGPAVTIIDCQNSGRGFNFNAGEGAGAGVDGFTIRNGSVVGNGGAIYCEGSSPTITNCTIKGNTASDDGGAISCYWYSDPQIINCRITGNALTDGNGGGIYCERSSPTITNCQITDNFTGSSGDGGGLYCYDGSSPTITNCTVANNWARFYAGIYCYLNSSPTITNSIVWGNTYPDMCAYNGSVPTVTYSDVGNGTGEPWFGTGCIEMDPLFVSGPLHDYYLSQTAAGQDDDSPCVNTGSDTAANLGLDALTTRTDGVPDTGIVDMGYHSPAPVPGDVDGNGVVDGLDLTAVLTAWDATPGHPRWNPAADLDGNGIINGLDLTEVISNWTMAAAAPAPAASAASPPAASEPTASERANPSRRGSPPGNVHRGAGNMRADQPPVNDK